jgi:NAD(P)-dependent dehydrogenase (short-subunit alcohol dehydrogenase family)
MKLENKVALVTGGGTGIGRAISLQFASEGANVAVSSRKMENLSKVAKEIKEKGRRSLAVVADVIVKNQVERMIEKVIEEFGQIDILVNNSGVSRSMPIVDFTEENWDIVMNTNVKGVMFCTQTVAKHMMKRKYGKIINISSTAALGQFSVGSSAYGTSKFAVNGFTKASAFEFGPYGINVNAICPGRILTNIVYSERTPEQVKEFVRVGIEASVLGRIGEVEDIAHLALFLASDDSSWITGEIIASNGGRTNLMGK